MECGSLSSVIKTAGWLDFVVDGGSLSTSCEILDALDFIAGKVIKGYVGARSSVDRAWSRWELDRPIRQSVPANSGLKFCAIGLKAASPIVSV